MPAHSPLPHYIADGPYRVLIVDDESSHRRLEREILLPPKYEVFEAGSGQEALDLIRSQPFDAVLLDKRMPDMDGDEVCRRIRDELGEPMLPVIMVTGIGGGADLSASLRAGADDFIRKPYSPMELVARLDAAVKHKRLTDQLDSAESMLFALARMVEAKDTYTGDHCSRLAHNAVVFGQALGLGQADILVLRRAGVLHDIGKLGIPEHILLKPGVLTQDEWAVMRQHCAIGAALCGGLKSMKAVLPIIRSHHERLDGGGYPDGLKGGDIPFLARVFQIVDIHDALAHHRPYKPALDPAGVIRIMEAETAQGWRDPELMAVFLDRLRARPEDFEVEQADADLGLAAYNEIVRLGAESMSAAESRRPD